MPNQRKEPNPQEVQQDGQGGISQEFPLNELNQEGSARMHEPVQPQKSELTNDEIAVLCDLEGHGSKPTQLHLLASLVERGFIVADALSQRLKLTAHAERLLSERGVGLNEA
jgi:hypothetical protein